MNTTALVEQLKAERQDFEFYPTTREMVEAIWNHRRGKWSDGSYNIQDLGQVLDIGCGTCNFRRWINDLNTSVEKQDGDYVERRDCVGFGPYYVMEKSRILLDKLDAQTVVLGTDFWESTLIDKPVDTIFCNPPYSEYEDWTVRIIRESVCKEIYLVIPQRWKQSEKIKLALAKVKIPFNRGNKLPDEERAFKVIGSFNFENAERAARSKVDILWISKEYTDRDSGFNSFFDDVFKMPDDVKKSACDYEERQSEMGALKTELAAGKNKIEILCGGYDAAQKQLFDHFKVICGMDADILKSIGITKSTVKEALKKKFEGLKNVYWQAAFDCLDEITSRLTSSSRNSFFKRFTLLKRVDFTVSNLYALVIWVIKNANQYTESQMINFYKALSSPENIRNYKSNIRVFKKDKWGYNNEKWDHYTLDYRIVCTEYALPGDSGYSYNNEYSQERLKHRITDICTVANNLGFPAVLMTLPMHFGKKGEVLTTIGGDSSAQLFTFRYYANHNIHVKFNKEFIKALNVAVARILGWIHSAEDIAAEFTPEMADGAEKYFKAFKPISLDVAHCLMLPTAPQEGMEHYTPAPGDDESGKGKDNGKACVNQCIENLTLTF